jgi:hypothetical protein
VPPLRWERHLHWLQRQWLDCHTNNTALIYRLVKDGLFLAFTLNASQIMYVDLQRQEDGQVRTVVLKAIFSLEDHTLLPFLFTGGFDACTSHGISRFLPSVSA